LRKHLTKWFMDNTEFHEDDSEGADAPFIEGNEPPA